MEQRVPPRIATNFANMRQACAGWTDIEQIDLDNYRSWRGLIDLLVGPRKADLIIVNIDVPSLLRLCVLRWLIPVRTTRLVSVDILLSRPERLRARASAFLKRLLLRKVDLFVLYFRDLAGYEHYYGIGQDRAAYVPFKSNSWELLSPSENLTSDGEYVLAAGKTKRDLATFLKAMSIAGLPGVLLHQDGKHLAEHGTTLPSQAPPENVRLVEHDGGRRTWIDHIKKARVVVVPILGSTISSSGIGVYLDSMALGKAVVISDGPATRGIISDQALVVPSGDANAMASAVLRLWSDGKLRRQIAGRARRYAESVEGERRLLRDVVRACIDRGLVI